MSDNNEERNSGYWYGAGLEAQDAGDYEEAVRCFTISAEMGFDLAQYELAFCYEEGEGVEQDIDQAIDWYAKAADQDYNPAWYSLGNIAYDREQYKLAVQMWTRAAELGSKGAKARLGYLHKTQRPVNDFQLAARWLREAVDDYQDDASDTLVYHWAQCLEFGLGVDPDIEEAKRWYRKAAGNDDAQQALAELERIHRAPGTPHDWRQNGVAAWNRVYEAWENGRGAEYSYKNMRDDRDEAARWWIRAAEAGDTTAMIDLADFFAGRQAPGPLLVPPRRRTGRHGRDARAGLPLLLRHRGAARPQGGTQMGHPFCPLLL